MSAGIHVREVKLAGCFEIMLHRQTSHRYFQLLNAQVRQVEVGLGLPDPAPWAGFTATAAISNSERILDDPEMPAEELQGLAPHAAAVLQGMGALPAPAGPSFAETAQRLNAIDGQQAC